MLTDDDGAVNSEQISIEVSAGSVNNNRDVYLHVEAETYDAMFGLGIYNGGTGEKSAR